MRYQRVAYRTHTQTSRGHGHNWTAPAPSALVHTHSVTHIHIQHMHHEVSVCKYALAKSVIRWQMCSHFQKGYTLVVKKPVAAEWDKKRFRAEWCGFSLQQMEEVLIRFVRGQF